MTRCSNCGTECKDNHIYCPQCGKALNAQTAAPQTTPQNTGGLSYSPDDSRFFQRALPMGYSIPAIISTSFSLVALALMMAGCSVGFVPTVFFYTASLVCPGVLMFGAFRYLFNKTCSAWLALISAVLSVVSFVCVAGFFPAPTETYEQIAPFVIAGMFFMGAFAFYAVMQVIFTVGMATKSGNKPLRIMHLIILVIEGAVLLLASAIFIVMMNGIFTTGDTRAAVLSDTAYAMLIAMCVLGVVTMCLRLASYIYMLVNRDALKMRV